MNSFRIGLLLTVALHGACMTSNDSKLTVTDGLFNLGDPSVVMIETTDPATMVLNRCTAFYVGPSILMTAAHCLVSKDTNEIRYVRTKGKTSLSMVAHRIHPQYFTEDKIDLALVKLEKGDHEPPPLSLSSHVPAPGTRVRLVGFGGNHYGTNKGEVEGGGVKRFGYTTIAYLDHRYLYSKGHRHWVPSGSSRPTGQQSALAKGDSGGPMLNDKNEVIGVASLIHEIENPKDPSEAILVAHTQIAIAQDFVKKSLDDLNK